MFTARQLMRLYPSKWRARYGDEFVEMLGRDRLRAQQVIDIISGAIDAWLSPDVRKATRIATVTGGTAMEKTLSICSGNERRYSTRDRLVGAAVMLGGTAILVLAATVLIRSGWTSAGEAILNMSFMVAMTLSMPFWLTKDQPRRAQAVLVGGTLAILTVIGAVAALN